MLHQESIPRREEHKGQSNPPLFERAPSKILDYIEELGVNQTASYANLDDLTKELPHLERQTTEATFQENPQYKLSQQIRGRVPTDSFDPQKGDHVKIIIERTNLLYNDPFLNENVEAAKNITKLLGLRDKYHQKPAECKCFCID